MTIREKVKAGHLYKDIGEGLDEERQRCKKLTYDYNLTRPSEGEKRRDLPDGMMKAIRRSVPSAGLREKVAGFDSQLRSCDAKPPRHQIEF
jgi:hypothetical protein